MPADLDKNQSGRSQQIVGQLPHFEFPDSTGRLRRDLMTAGIVRHELHRETATTLPVDFHSTRRAYATALARIGMNEQTAMIMTGHSDPKVHQRYIEAASIRALPDAAVPEIGSAAVETIRRTAHRPFPKANRGEAKRKPARTLSQPADLVSNFGAGEEIRTLDVHLGKVKSGVSSGFPPLLKPRNNNNQTVEAFLERSKRFDKGGRIGGRARKRSGEGWGCTRFGVRPRNEGAGDRRLLHRDLKWTPKFGPAAKVVIDGACS